MFLVLSSSTLKKCLRLDYEFGFFACSLASFLLVCEAFGGKERAQVTLNPPVCVGEKAKTQNELKWQPEKLCCIA